MTSAELRKLVAEKNPQDLLGLCVKDDLTPFAFNINPDSWTKFRDTFAAEFNVNPQDIRVVGSGRLGLSTKPGKNLKAFGDTSDIDVLIVSDVLFDSLWVKLLQAAYNRSHAAVGSTANNFLWLYPKKGNFIGIMADVGEPARDSFLKELEDAGIECSASAKWDVTLKLSPTLNAIQENRDLFRKLFIAAEKFSTRG